MSIYDLAKYWFFTTGIAFVLLLAAMVSAAVTGDTSPDDLAWRLLIYAIIVFTTGLPGWAVSMADNRPLSERERRK